MNYSIGKTPTIDAIVIKSLLVPVITPEVNPLDSLEIVRQALDQALNKDKNTEELPDLSKHYRSLSPKLLKAALWVVNRRIEYAEALDSYLYALYEESVGKDFEMTPHSQVESTPRFNFDKLDRHLKYYLLQGTENDIVLNGNEARKERPRTTLNKTLESSSTTSFLIADCFATAKKYRKSSGDLNIKTVSEEVLNHANKKYGPVTGQSDSSIRNRLNDGKIVLPDPRESK